MYGKLARVLEVLEGHEPPRYVKGQDVEETEQMDTENVLKAQLDHKLALLPDDRLREVLDYVELLLSKGQKVVGIPPQETLDPGKDSILAYSGGVAHGSLAHNIDEELYGP